METNYKLFASWEMCLLLDEFLWASPTANQNLFAVDNAGNSFSLFVFKILRLF